MFPIFKRASWHLLFWSLLVSASGLTALRISLHAIGHFKQEIAQYGSDRLGTTVTIGRLSAKMQGFTPHFHLQEISIEGPAQQKPALQLQEIRIRLNLWSLLTDRSFWPATSITLVGAQLSLQRNLDGSFSVMGLTAGDGQPYWLLQGNHYEMLQSEITFKDWAHPGIAFKPAGIDLAIDNDGDQHSVKAAIRVPSRYGGNISLAMEWAGNFFASGQVDGRAYLEAHDVQLKNILNDYLPSLEINGGGMLESKLWARVGRSTLKDLQGEINVTRANLGHPHTLASQFHWRQTHPDDKRWRLDVPKLALISDQKKTITQNRLSVTSDFSLRDWAWSIHHLNLSDAFDIGQWLLPKAHAKTLKLYQLTGSLDNFTGIALPGQGHFAVRGQFNRIGLVPIDGQPGFNGLSGTVNGNHHQGRIKLVSNQAHLMHLGLFRQELAVKKLHGGINWQQLDNQWILSSPSLKIELPGIQAENTVHLTLSKQSGPPFLDWQAVLSDSDVGQLKRYLPAKIMKPVDVDWFDAAFIKGTIKQGRVLYYGPLGPLKSAVFRALLDVDGVELRYDPEWPVLTGVKGRVSFVQNKMVGDISQGHSLKLDIINATVVHPAIGASKQLQVNGEIAGTLPDALAFLNHTELKEDVGGLVAAIQAQGQTKISLDLDLALTKQGRTRLHGNVLLNSARLKVKAIDLWLEHLNGALKFNEKGVFSEIIKASALNHPIAITLGHDDAKTLIKAHGKASVDDFEQQFTLPLSHVAHGTTAYQLTLELPRGNSPPALKIHSDLAGVGLDLPGPLAKKPEQRKPLALAFHFVDGPLRPIYIEYNRQFKAAIRLDTDTKTLHSGTVLLGEGQVTQAAGNRLNITINLPNLDLSALSFLAATAASNGNDASPAFSHLAIDSCGASWKGQPLGRFKLTLDQQGNYWEGQVASTFALGTIRIPVNLNPTGKATLNLQLLDVSALETSEQFQPKQPSAPQDDAAIKPQNLPLFTITSNTLLWNGVDLGQLRLHTERIIDGLGIKEAKIIGHGKKLTVNGRWQHVNGKTSTELDGSLTVSGVGALLHQLDITREFKETDGRVNFLVGWNAPPYDLQLSSLSGNLEVTLKNGRILSVEPGFGKWLGLVAMAQWNRRLQLDFRDIFDDGLSFNTIKGRFRLNNGVADTDDLVVDAIPAKIRLTGKVDLTNKTLDQIVRVIPKSADAVPIAGTIIYSVVDMASRTLTGKSGEGVFLGSEYQIQGAWDELRIIPTHKNDGLVHKTWDTLTELPSLPLNIINNK